MNTSVVWDVMCRCLVWQKFTGDSENSDPSKYTIYSFIWELQATGSKGDENRMVRWLGCLLLHSNARTDPCRKLTLLKPEGNRRVGKPQLRWLESVEENLKNMGVRNWRRK